MSKFYTRSALMQQLIPNPSEGKIRALFGTGKNAILAKCEEMRTKHSMLQKAKLTQINESAYGESLELSDIPRPS